MTTISIDPGANGAIAIFDAQGALQRVIDLPTVKVASKTRIAPQALALLVAAQRPSQAYVEQVASRPGQGVTSMFTFGHNAGAIDGVLAALGVPVSYITPQVWKRTAQVTADKGSSRRRAMQLFPGHAADFQRVKDDGRAEAALIGWCALQRRQ